MWKIFLLCLTITTPTFAADKSSELNQSKVNFVSNIRDDTLKCFYDLAISEYDYSNFGFSRDLFSAIIQKTSKQPGAYFFLAKIYEEVNQFKNVDMAKQYYLSAAISKSLAPHMRQESYLALIRLTDNADLAIKYAKASGKICNSDESKQALILAYHKQFDKTGDEDLLVKVEQVTRQMNQKLFDFPSDIATQGEAIQQVNLQK